MCVHFGVEVARKQSNTAFPIKSASLNAVGCFLRFLIWYEPRMCGARAFENISLVRTIAHASRQTRHRMSHRSSPSHHVHGQHHHNHHHHIRDIIIITIIISSSFTSEFLIAVVVMMSSSLSIISSSVAIWLKHRGPGIGSASCAGQHHLLSCPAFLFGLPIFQMRFACGPGQGPIPLIAAWSV